MHDPPHITPPPLAPTLASLGDDPRRALDRLHEMGFRYVQLSAMQPGMKPRELDRSARRDLLATMRRRELQPAGLDLWIPPEHFTDPAHVDRAVAATIAAIEMSADLGRIPVSMTLPPGQDVPSEAVTTIIDTAHRCEAPIADHTVFADDAAQREHDEHFGIGIDPAAWLSSGHDPAKVVTAHAAGLITARLCDLSTNGTRIPIGQRDGRLDVTAYKVALSVAGYVRPVILDARQWTNPWIGVEQSPKAWS